MNYFFAQLNSGGAPADFWGHWLIVAIGITSGLGGLAAIASYFATRRELIALEKRVSIVEAEQKHDREQNQIHASERSKTLFSEIKDNREKLEARIHPLVENTAGMKASQEAFITAFTEFTEVMRQMIGHNQKHKP